MIYVNFLFVYLKNVYEANTYFMIIRLIYIVVKLKGLNA